MQEWLLTIASGFAVSAAFAFLIKKLPDMLGKWLDKKIDYLFEKGGPAEDKLIFALVCYAQDKIESQFPFGKTGEEKFKLVADKLMTLLMPVLDFLPSFIKPAVLKRSDKLAEAIERNVKAMKDVLATNKVEHKGK